MKSNEIIKAWMNYAITLFPDYTVIHSEELAGKDGPRPKLPYMSLKLIAGPTMNTIDSQYRKNSSRNFDLISRERYTLSVQVFGSNEDDSFEYLDVLKSFKNQLDSPDRLEQLRSEGDIGIQNRGSVRDISMKMQTGYERRATLDIIFLSSDISDIGLTSIESVEISGSLNSEDGSSEIETNQTINKP